MKILLQIIIFVLFLFSNGYQGLVTSFMLVPLRQEYLKTIDELIDSDIIIEIDSLSNLTLFNRPKYLEAIKANRIRRLVSEGKNKFLYHKTNAFIQLCDQAAYRMERFCNGKVYYNIYLIHEPLFGLPNQLYTGYWNPYDEVFQHYMDLSFEAGLHGIWKTFYVNEFSEEALRRHGRKVFENRLSEEEKDILDFNSILPFFLILMFGFSLGLMALLCEIFNFDFIARLPEDYMKNKIKSLFRKKIQQRT